MEDDSYFRPLPLQVMHILTPRQVGQISGMIPVFPDPPHSVHCLVRCRSGTLSWNILPNPLRRDNRLSILKPTRIRTTFLKKVEI